MAVDFSPHTQTKVILGFTSKTRASLAVLSSQISSGNKHSDYVGFAGEGNTEKYTSLKSTLDGIESYKRSVNVASTRLDATEQAVSELQKIADEFASTIVSRRNSASGSTIPVALLGDSALGKIANNLNAKFDNRFIFAGSKTNTTPVQNITVTNIDGNNQATASYYKGDSVKPSVRVNDTQEVTYGTLANESGFQKLIGAIHMAIDGHNEDNDSTLQSAMTMINESIVEIAGVMTNIKATAETLEGLKTSLNDAELLYSENFVNIAKTDIVEATTKMSEQEAQLEASFIAFTRLSRLNLSEFL